MSSIRKAAVVLNSLPPEQAAALQKQLAAHEAQAVSAEMAQIGSVSERQRLAILVDFARSHGPSRTAAAPAAPKFVAVDAGQAASGNADSDTGGDASPASRAAPFESLRGLDGFGLLALLDSEQIQTIAVVLSQLAPRQAAAVIAALDESRRVAVLQRIAALRPVAVQIVEELGKALQGRLAKINSQADRAAGVRTAAQIIEATPHSARRGLLRSLAQENPTLVEQINRLANARDHIALHYGTAADAAARQKVAPAQNRDVATGYRPAA